MILNLLTITIYITHALGSMGASEQEMTWMLNKAKRVYKEQVNINVDFVFDSEILAENFHAKYASFALFELYQNYLFPLRLLDKPRGVIAPMMCIDGYCYTAGASPVCRYKNGYFIVLAGPKNKKGEPRLLHGAYTIIHELGHLLGAKHSKKHPCSIMGANMLTCVRANRKLRFDAETKKQFRECLMENI